MPIYEYVCRQCGNRFEVLRPMSASGHAQCPDCGQAAQRVLSVFAAVNRDGDGFTTPITGTGGGCGGCGGNCACSAH